MGRRARRAASAAFHQGNDGLHLAAEAERARTSVDVDSSGVDTAVLSSERGDAPDAARLRGIASETADALGNAGSRLLKLVDRTQGKGLLPRVRGLTRDAADGQQGRVVASAQSVLRAGTGIEYGPDGSVSHVFDAGPLVQHREAARAADNLVGAVGSAVDNDIAAGERAVFPWDGFTIGDRHGTPGQEKAARLFEAVAFVRSATGASEEQPVGGQVSWPIDAEATRLRRLVMGEVEGQFNEGAASPTLNIPLGLGTQLVVTANHLAERGGTDFNFEVATTEAQAPVAYRDPALP